LFIKICAEYAHLLSFSRKPFYLSIFTDLGPTY